MINLVFSGAVFTLSRRVKLVDSETDNLSHCLVLYATGSLAFDLIVLQLENFSASARITQGMNHEILSRLTCQVSAAADLKIASSSVFLTRVRLCFNPQTILS